MSDSNIIKPPKWFWVVSVVALIWNLLGVMAFVAHVTISDAKIAALPEAEQLLYQDSPVWSTVVFALAVFGGALGSLALVLRKRWAFPVLIVSLVGIVAQLADNLFVKKVVDVYGPGRMIMPVMVLLIGIYLVFFAKSSTNKGWLN